MREKQFEELQHIGEIAYDFLSSINIASYAHATILDKNAMRPLPWALATSDSFSQEKKESGEFDIQ